MPTDDHASSDALDLGIVIDLHVLLVLVKRVLVVEVLPILILTVADEFVIIIKVVSSLLMRVP